MVIFMGWRARLASRVRLRLARNDPQHRPRTEMPSEVEGLGSPARPRQAMSTNARPAAGSRPVAVGRAPRAAAQKARALGRERRARAGDSPLSVPRRRLDRARL